MYPGVYNMEADTGPGYAGTRPYGCDQHPESNDLNLGDEPPAYDADYWGYHISPTFIIDSVLEDLETKGPGYKIPERHAWPLPIDEDSTAMSSMGSQTDSGGQAMNPGADETPFHEDRETLRIPTMSLPLTINPAELLRDASASSPLLASLRNTPELSDNDGATSSATTLETPGDTTWEPAPGPRLKWVKAKFKDLEALSKAEILNLRPYDNWRFVRPKLTRFKTRKLYLLAQTEGWSTLVSSHGKDMSLSMLAELKAEVEADATAMLAQMGERAVGTLEATATARVKAFVLGKLDCEIAMLKNLDPPTLPADACHPGEEELEQDLRKIRDRDWVSCIWCGRERPAREDRDNIERHAGLGGKSGCSQFAVLAQRGLLTEWLDKHIRSIHDHDIVQITMNSVAKAAIPASARDIIPASPAPVPAQVLVPAPAPAPAPMRRTSGRKKAVTSAPARKQSNIGPKRTTKTKTRKGQY
ncbi:hypothetical protein AURDEDRAFT_160238 [Auricularia subglabra TFB-10046 SS5]|nr:hypothetical protein AURDEDRAFT_160238 [Auricularia subglabra TFB-10046 SS5]